MIEIVHQALHVPPFWTCENKSQDLSSKSPVLDKAAHLPSGDTAAVTLLLMINHRVRDLLVLLTPFPLYFPLWSCPQTQTLLCAAKVLPKGSNSNLNQREESFVSDQKMQSEKNEEKMTALVQQFAWGFCWDFGNFYREIQMDLPGVLPCRRCSCTVALQPWLLLII